MFYPLQLFVSSLVPVVLVTMSMIFSTSTALANDKPEQSYEALIDWISKAPPNGGRVEAGRHLTAADRQELLEPLVPISAWEYYIIVECFPMIQHLF